MTRYIIKRLLTIIPVLIGVSMLVFAFIRLIPGDTATAMLGERATPERIAAVREELGLNKPLYEQYLIYANKVLHGDLGRSILRGDPVTKDLLRRFPATVELAAAAILVAIVIGVPAGVISAVRRNSMFDNASRLVALTGVSMPIFWLGLMLSWLFGVMLHWLPTGGRLTVTLADLKPFIFFGHQIHTNSYIIDSLLTLNFTVLIDALRHLILPAVALGTIPMAIIARMTRSSMLEVMSQDYIRTAASKGLTERTVVTRHALKNALLPVVTVVGLQVGRLLSGAILTETIFGWPGIGSWIYDSIVARDYPIVQGTTMFIAGIFVLVNLLVDVLYAGLDPRIRFD
jgi:peptide/nickel transport system permease protein